MAPGLAMPSAVLAASPPTGLVHPAQPAPRLLVRGDDGGLRTLDELLRGHATAVQLMFTGCRTTCPLQGAAFAEIASRLEPAGPRLLSLSIDALGDDPKSLRGWLDRFGADPRWRAAVPRPNDVDTLSAFLRGAAIRPGTHSDQIFFFDRQARLVYRSGDSLPPPIAASWLTRLHSA